MGAFRIAYSARANRDVNDAVLFFVDLQSRGMAADPERFVHGLLAFVAEEAARQEALSISRPAVTRGERIRLIAQGQSGVGAMRLLYRTPGGSPWYVYFNIEDTDGDGEKDTLTVLHLRHGLTTLR